MRKKVARVDKFGVCDSSLSEYIPCFDNVEEF